jgi:hypothetical protein
VVAGPSGTDTTAPATTTPPAEPTSTTTAPDGLLPPLVPGG